MKHIIAISGKSSSGKDTLASFLPRYENLKFATALYAELDCLGFTQDQIDSDKEIIRPIMIAIGDARRHFDPDYYVDLLLDTIHLCGDLVVVTDVRFKNEVEGLRRFGSSNSVPVTFVRLYRNGFDRSGLGNRLHKSECDLDYYNGWDYVVNVECGDMARLEKLGLELTR